MAGGQPRSARPVPPIILSVPPRTGAPGAGPVGVAVGDAVGVAVGVAVGDFVGVAVGEAVGVLVGVEVGVGSPQLPRSNPIIMITVRVINKYFFIS
jgi:hypothetical protein